MSNFISYSCENSIARVQINRPEKRNALLLEMRDRLADLFEQMADDQNVRAVLLSAEGGSFCAGADVEEMGKGGLAGSLMRARHMQRLMRNISRLEKPVVCAVQGNAVGMGFSIALACDLVVAARSARFSQVQCRIALPPDAGAVWYLSRYLGLARAKEIALTGRTVPAEEALSIGLVAKVVDDAKLAESALEQVMAFAKGPTIAYGIGKRMFDLAPSSTLDDFLEHEASMVPLAVTSSDFKEGTAAFLEKRPAEFTGK